MTCHHAWPSPGRGTDLHHSQGAVCKASCHPQHRSQPSMQAPASRHGVGEANPCVIGTAIQACCVHAVMADAFVGAAWPQYQSFNSTLPLLSFRSAYLGHCSTQHSECNSSPLACLSLASSFTLAPQSQQRQGTSTTRPSACFLPTARALLSASQHVATVMRASE